MKDVIDVMELQREKNRNKVPRIDFMKNDSTFVATHFIFECGLKLQAQPLTVATAAVLFHRFMKEVDPKNYDPYTIAASVLYLAGKNKDDNISIRDMINVSRDTLHRGSSPLELGDEFWSIRDAIVQAELLIMRILKFDISVQHPHKYMLHYLRSLQSWIDENDWKKTPIARVAANFLQDFHHHPAILDYSPQHIAIACIALTLQAYGVSVPLLDDVDEANSTNVWYSAFVKDLTKDKLWEIMEKIMDVYKDE